MIKLPLKAAIIHLAVLTHLFINGFSLASPPNLEQQVAIENYGEPNLQKLLTKVSLAKKRAAPPDSVLRITQLGDSHTAADMLTGNLREKLQQHFGNAGIGWVTPMNVYGQRNALISYTNTDWSLTSSRTTKAPDYPLGGFIATPSSTEAKLTFSYHGSEKTSLWNATFFIKQENLEQPLRIIDGMNYETILQPKRTREWQYVNAYVMFPFTIIAGANDSVKLGGVWLEKNGEPGITLSSIGTNGARQSIWGQWRKDWLTDLAQTNTDLIIIAYGTNEAFEPNFNIEYYKKMLTQYIQDIRKTLPDSSILIIAAPDAMQKSKVNKTNDCAEKQPPSLSIIREAQQDIAKKNHTLYWDWQKAMGGNCSMTNWNSQGLAANDLIHLTAAGYQQSANSLFNALMDLFKGH